MAALFRRSRNACQCPRAFSTATPRRVNLQWEKNDPEALADALPPYPYGPTQWYKQSRSGLYGGSRIQFGNNVSDEFETKTRRTWKPNVLTRKLFSKALNRHVQVRVSARVLRTIDKLGGLDEYLLGEKEARIKELGETGWWLRWAIMQTPAVRARFAKERKQLGLPKSREEIAVEEEAVALANETNTFEDNAYETVAADAQSHRVARESRVKFRVAPKTHLYRSSAGWRRSWAKPWLTDSARKALADKFFPDWVSSRVDAARVTLRSQLNNMDDAQKLTVDEQKRILNAVEKDLKQQLPGVIDAWNDRRVGIRRMRRYANMQRSARKRAQAAKTKLRE